MIPNEEKEGWHYLAVKKMFTLLRGITSKHGEKNFNLTKKYVTIKIFVEL